MAGEKKTTPGRSFDEVFRACGRLLADCEGGADVMAKHTATAYRGLERLGLVFITLPRTKEGTRASGPRAIFGVTPSAAGRRMLQAFREWDVSLQAGKAKPPTNNRRGRK